MAIQNIIFDWSGTISDDFKPVYLAIMTIFNHYGLKKLSEETFRKEFELPYMNFYKRYIPGISKSEQDKLYSKAIHEVGEPTMYLSVLNTLDILKKKKIKMAVLSSHPNSKLLKEAISYGIKDFFADINGSVHDKVEEIQRIMGKNNFEPDETLYVGDMVHDIDAAKKAGIKVAVLTWGYDSKEKLSPHKPDYIFNDIKEILSLIK